MKAAMMIALVSTVAVSSAFAVGPAKPAPMGGKDMMQQCEAMKSTGKSAQQGEAQGKGMDCQKDGISDEHMKQMHDHMKDMHGGGGMMGKGGMGGMPMDAAAKDPGAKDAAPAKPAAPVDAVDHSAHHPK